MDEMREPRLVRPDQCFAYTVPDAAKFVRKDWNGCWYFPAIAVCTSVKFEHELPMLYGVLTYAGWRVLPVCTLNLVHQRLYYPRENPEGSPELRRTLRLMHEQKIRLADAVYVFNKDRYIGESVTDEIEYAEKLGRQIFYAVADEERGDAHGQ